jgi:LPS export ABC transporter protein LptC
MKKIPVVLWPIGGICFLLALFAFFFVNRVNVTTLPSKIQKVIPKESLKISDIDFRQDYNDGQEKWNLKAKEASFSKKTNAISLRHVLLTIRNSDNNQFTVEGSEGNYFKGSGEIQLKGDVTGKSLSGYQMYTEQLHYNQKNESVETKNHVKITGPFFKISGDGLFADIKEEKITIIGNIHATFLTGEFNK